GGILARDDVLVQRRDIDQRSRIANRVVLVLVMHLIGAYRVVSGPLAVVQAVAQRKSTLVKCGPDWQEISSKDELLSVELDYTESGDRSCSGDRGDRKTQNIKTADPRR